jgi:23S rRNA (cytidine1920-2'-O)/16S rRNA (cytidine1409-2'-O)-methyltransferase
MAHDRRRADLVLVGRGFFDSRAKAQAAIAAGLVTADGEPVRKASDAVREDAAIEATPAHPYVSRGGIKLAAALDAFSIDPVGLACLDVGASTGGFTDVLLRRGAVHVHAVDVGRGQLHPSLLSDPRVTSLEATDIRCAEPVLVAHSVDLATVDVSFISSTLILPSLLRYLRKQAQLVVLVKPQFEVGKAGLGRGGIVRDAVLRESSVERLRALAVELGFRIIGIVSSPIAGGDGNEEFLLGAARG